MNKYQIMTLMMREENHFDVDIFTIAPLLAERLEGMWAYLSDEDLVWLIRIGSAIYQHGVEQLEHSVAVEDMFPKGENWPVPIRTPFSPYLR